MVPQLMDAFDLDVAGIGWLTSNFLFVYLFLQIPAGYLADRCNLRWLLVICSLLMAVDCYWFSISDSLWPLFASRTLMGVIAAPGIISCLTLAARWMPLRHFPAMAGLAESFIMMGGSLGPLVLPNLIDCCGWSWAMKSVALAGLIIAFMIFVFVKNEPNAPMEKSSEQSGCTDQSHDGNKGDLDKATMIKACVFGFGIFSCFGGLWGMWQVFYLLVQQ